MRARYGLRMRTNVGRVVKNDRADIEESKDEEEGDISVAVAVFPAPGLSGFWCRLEKGRPEKEERSRPVRARCAQNL